MSRSAQIKRMTQETDITILLNIDGGGSFGGSSGIGFFDHMLTALAVHSGMLISVQMNGDLKVDCHHSIEDAGIVLGKAISTALGDKSGIMRFGSAYIPMDEALVHCALDLSGRPYCVINGLEHIKSPMIGDFDTQMLPEFFRALAMSANMTLHLDVRYGQNAHHIAEAMFKAFAHALAQAKTITGGGVLSSKGIL